MDRRAERDATISRFLTTAGWASAARDALTGDAAFRRHWRLTVRARRAALMDAPRDKLDIRPFLPIDAHLRGLGSFAPEILAADPVTGLAHLSGADFDVSRAVIAAHRHVKFLGLFVRPANHDGKPGYLRHIPRLWRLLGQSLTHPALHELAHWLEREVSPAIRVVPDL